MALHERRRRSRATTFARPRRRRRSRAAARAVPVRGGDAASHRARQRPLVAGAVVARRAAGGRDASGAVRDAARPTSPRAAAAPAADAVRRSEHRVLRGRRRASRSRRRPSSPSRLHVLSSPCPARRRRSCRRAFVIDVGEQSQVVDRRELRGRRRRSRVHQRGDATSMLGAGRGASITSSCSASRRRRSIWRACSSRLGPREHVHVARDHVRRPHRAQRHRRDARRRGRRVHAERPVRRRRRQRSSTRTRRSTTRSRTARATSSTRASWPARRARSSTARSSSGQDAQKTDAKQTNKALLLSDDAQINTKPQLEIFADDVKCTHGAAIGQLDEDALFYLRARGIGASEARNMLIHAFAGEVLDGIHDRRRARARRCA